MNLPPQKTLKNGRYELLRVLGEGSQGSTYEARDGSRDPAEVEKPRPEALLQNWNRYVDRARAGESGRPRPDTVAIKAFVVTKAKAWKDVELAEREAKTLASIDHPNLPRYIEHFEEDGVLYLVMEKIEGGSLAQLRLGENDIVRMVEDIAAALRYLHGRAPAIVHRDVKPGNILRRPDGSYALVDFGSVRDRLKPAGGSTVVGTFGYMAPEQFQGRASPQSDVYALGVTAITMLTGCAPEELPHQGLRIDVAKALPRSTSRRLVAMLTAMVEPDPDRRVGSVDEALAILRQGSGRTGNREQAKRDEREEKRARRRAKRERRRQRGKHASHGGMIWAGIAASLIGFAVGREVGVLVTLVVFVAMYLLLRVLVRPFVHVRDSIARAEEEIASDRRVRVATDHAREAETDEENSQEGTEERKYLKF